MVEFVEHTVALYVTSNRVGGFTSETKLASACVLGSCVPAQILCPRGENGKRARLKILCPQGLAGSIPVGGIKMNRAQFLKNCSLLALGTIAANQIDLLEKITGPKSLFTGMGLGTWGFQLWDIRDLTHAGLHEVKPHTFTAQRGEQIKIPLGMWYPENSMHMNSIAPVSYGGMYIKQVELPRIGSKLILS